MTMENALPAPDHDLRRAAARAAQREWDWSNPRCPYSDLQHPPDAHLPECQPAIAALYSEEDDDDSSRSGVCQPTEAEPGQLVATNLHPLCGGVGCDCPCHAPNSQRWCPHCGLLQHVERLPSKCINCGEGLTQATPTDPWARSAKVSP